jgi:CHASE2 domain-containing sensor protein
VKRQSESRPAKAARSNETLTPTLLALLAATLTLVAMIRGDLDAGELYSFNLRCQWRPQRVPTDNVFLLVIDEGTVQSDILEFGTFPWARRIWARLQSGFIDQLQPNCIAYDIIFDQPDHVEGSDDQFAEAIERSDNVLLAFSLLLPSSRPVSATESREYDSLW